MDRGYYNRGDGRGAGGGTRGGGGRGGRIGGSGRQVGDQPHHYPPQRSEGRGRGRGPSYGGDGGRGGGRSPGYGGSGGRGAARGSSSYGGGPGRGTRPHQTQGPSELVPDLETLKIRERVPAPSAPRTARTDLFPVKRPDQGGLLSIKSPRLLANHFPVTFNSNSTIIHYDIDIKPVLNSESGSSKLQKSYLRMIKEKLFSDNPSDFPLSRTAYDGEKNIYSAVQLPTGTFMVDFSVAEDMRATSYSVTIKEVNMLKLSDLKNYLEGKVIIIPRAVLQGMDVVMRENPSRCRITVGRSFFPTENRREDDLNWGITASKGLQQSLKSTSQGLALCLDYTVLAFRKRLPVIDYLLEYMGCRDVRELVQMDRGEILLALKSVKVNVTHRLTKQKFIIADITSRSTRDIYFDAEDPERGSRRVGVVEYFREKYNREIVHQGLPCLDLGKNNRQVYVPMEFCILVEGQRFPKEHLDRDGQRCLKNMSLVPPHVRRNTICDMVRAGDGPCGGEVTPGFGLRVIQHMTEVASRVIGPPQLKVGASGVVSVDRNKCQWNLVGKSVLDGKPLERWALIDFSSRERNPKYKLDRVNFINNLINRCQNLGIRIEPPLVYRPTDMTPFSNVNVLQKLLENVIKEGNEKRKGPLQMIVCVMSAVDPGYKTLKWLSETKLGIVTQCCLSEHANQGKDQYLANLGIKINAKLGGSNMELTHEFPYFPGEGHAMFIGADVNHPSPGNSNAPCSRDCLPPSIAAVVGTINWPAANRYAARVSAQYGRTEKILNFGSLCKELIETYVRFNGVKPQRIVVFRDGVSEGQFAMVLNEELFDLKNAIYEEHYRPTITVVVAQKRHHTRLFPTGGESGNVLPGTIVDTVITHPFEFDFYLCSHYGGIGTSKPTHYYVLYDDHNFNSDLLQQLIYELCFTFARCTKPVSLVPPVYYADLVAYRGRMFQEAAAMASPGSMSSSRTVASRASSSSAAPQDDNSYKLHPELVNNMFFV